MGALNVLDLPQLEKNAIPIIVQNVNGTNGQNGHLVVRAVDTGEHKFAGEAIRWKQVTEDGIVLVNPEKKKTAQFNSVVKKISKIAAKMKHGACT